MIVQILTDDLWGKTMSENIFPSPTCSPDHLKQNIEAKLLLFIQASMWLQFNSMCISIASNPRHVLKDIDVERWDVFVSAPDATNDDSGLVEIFRLAWDRTDKWRTTIACACVLSLHSAWKISIKSVIKVGATPYLRRGTRHEAKNLLLSESFAVVLGRWRSQRLEAQLSSGKLDNCLSDRTAPFPSPMRSIRFPCADTSVEAGRWCWCAALFWRAATETSWQRRFVNCCAWTGRARRIASRWYRRVAAFHRSSERSTHRLERSDR